MIKKRVSNSKMYIDNMVKMVCRNDISVDVVNELPIREDGMEKRGKA